MMDLLTRQFLRALRGHRSQTAFARRLGYRSNPIANWEAGRHFPTAGEAMRAAARVELDVMGALEQVGGARAGAPRSLDDHDLAHWLSALRGPLSLADIGERAQASRFQVERWFAGRTRPRLPQFFALVDAMTGRLGEFLLRLVPLEALPALTEPERVGRLTRELIKRELWMWPVLCVLSTRAWADATEPLGAAWIADRLEIPVETVDRCLSGLISLGVLRWHLGRWALVPAAVALQVPIHPKEVPDWNTRWAAVIADRTRTHHPEDHGYCVVSAVPARAWSRIQAAIERCHEEVWAAGADNDPEEVVSLVYIRLVKWVGPEGA